jgi:hypothetical protein
MTLCAIGNNKETGAAGSVAAYVGTGDVTNVSIEEVNLIAHSDASLVYVTCSFYWYPME